MSIFVFCNNEKILSTSLYKGENTTNKYNNRSLWKKNERSHHFKVWLVIGKFSWTKLSYDIL